jgi:hypothetical protein
VSSSLTVKGRLFGGMSEWFMVAVLKTVERGDPLRGFESYFLRSLQLLLGSKLAKQPSCLEGAEQEINIGYGVDHIACIVLWLISACRFESYPNSKTAPNGI